MLKMRCTLTELRQQPADELETFRAFMAGEAAAQEALRNPA